MDTSYLTTQVANITGQLHGVFDEIGVPHHERESRETKLFNALSAALHDQLRLVNNEKHEMTEEAHHIINTIKQMETSLEGTRSSNNYESDHGELKVTFPLIRCLQHLKEKHVAISKIHRDRFEQVKKLVQALQSYSSHLESSFVKISLPPTSGNEDVPPSFDLSPNYVTALDKEFTRVYEEYSRRVQNVQTFAEDIVKLWAELGTPQAQTDDNIVQYYNDSPEQLGLHQSDLNKLQKLRESLLDEKRGREKRLRDLKSAVEGLWDRLGMEAPERKTFLNSNRGCGVRVINEFEDELSRLNELKRQNLHLFVEDARYKLQELWDSLYFSEEEMLDFTPAFSDVYSDALLSAHEGEIGRLEALREQRAPMLDLINRHRTLVKEREDLAASSQDASRLMLRGHKGEKRDPTRLLREEKMRKRIAKELPKITEDLRKALEHYEDEYGRPFMVHGESYLAELAATESKAPPRSKTPAGPPSSNRNPRSTGASAPPSRAASVASAARAMPPPRTGAKTPSFQSSTVKRNPLASSMSSTTGGRSPSRIPARVPLSNMAHGKNSPERNKNHAANTAHKMGPPQMAPPPKMRNLYGSENQPAPNYNQDYRSGSTLSLNDNVRAISPEDVYDDRAQYASLHSTMNSSRQYAPPNGHGYPGDSRQVSATSSASNAVSGSENWETYDDASEPEPDASDTYYAKLRAARNKRLTPDGGYTSPRNNQVKRPRGIHNVEAKMETVVEQNGQMIKVSGSEAGWTDEDAF